MAGPIISLSRWIAKKRNASILPTGIIPLWEVHSVVLVADCEEPGCEEALMEAEKFFSSENIALNIFTTDKNNLDLLGRIRRKMRYRSGVMEQEDLFICLAGKPSFACRYEAVCSRSRCKIGRVQLHGDVFDVVFRDPEGKSYSQLDVFKTIAEFLKSVR